MRQQWRCLAACGLLLVMPALVCAQHEPPGGEPTAGHATQTVAHGGGHDADAAKPALLQYDPGAAIWSIIVFFGLLVLLRATAWKPILRVLHEREDFIARSIADAKLERERAERLLADYQAQLDRAREEASVIVAEGRRDAEVVARRVQEQARRETEEILARARREIQLASDSARKELHDEAAELAVQVAARVIHKQLSAADHRELVARSLKEMQTPDKGKMN